VQPTTSALERTLQAASLWTLWFMCFVSLLLSCACGRGGQMPGHRVQLGQSGEKGVERVGDELLGRPVRDRAGQAQAKVPIRLEAKRERRLALGAGRLARTQRQRHHLRLTRHDLLDRSRHGLLHQSRHDFHNGFGHGLHDRFGYRFHDRFVRGLGEARLDHALLFHHRRRHRLDFGERHAAARGGRQCGDRTRHMFGTIVEIWNGGDRWSRAPAHVVPAQILETHALPPALRAHRRLGRSLAGEQGGGERREAFEFSHLCSPPLLADHAAAEAACGSGCGSGLGRARG
jgi:hypothetical protein